MSSIQQTNIFNPGDFQTLKSSQQTEAAKAKACAQQFDSLILSKILEKALESPLKDDTKATMSGSGIYTTLKAQVLANSLTQEGGLKIADPKEFLPPSARSTHES